MHFPRVATRFLGDLHDPCVRSIADALPPSVFQEHLPGSLNSAKPAHPSQSTQVIHRPVISESDLGWLKRNAEAGDDRRRIILIVGPHVRFHQIQRCGEWVDAILPEATASQTLSRILPTPVPAPPDRPRPPVAILGSTRDLLDTIADACRDAGHPVRVDRGPVVTGTEPLIVWEAPVLEPDWPAPLRKAGRDRGIVALIGFADRQLVDEARRAGASACLDLPCDPSDLVETLARLEAAQAADRRRVA